MGQDKGASACADRAVVNGACEQSPPSASVPSAGTIGFTGTQKGCERKQIVSLQYWLERLSGIGFEWMRNGDCVGADAEAAAIWRGLGRKLFLHPPTFDSKRAFLPYDEIALRMPYLERNKDIAVGSKVLVATPSEMAEQQRGGTWSTIRFANRRGQPHLIIYPDGSYVGRNGFAQAIEARRAETQGGSVHESAVRKDAPHA